MPITTFDCRKAIAKSFIPAKLTIHNAPQKELVDPANWKRITKRKTGMDSYVRQFRNQKFPGLLVNVHSSSSKVKEVKKSVEPMPPLEKGKKKVEVPKVDIRSIIEGDQYDAVYNLPWYDLPRINTMEPPSEDERQETERLIEQYQQRGDWVPRSLLTAREGEQIELVDFENWGIDSYGDDFVKMEYAGGDWQPSTAWTSRLGNDGMLHVDTETIEYQGTSGYDDAVWQRPSDGVLTGRGRQWD